MQKALQMIAPVVSRLTFGLELETAIDPSNNPVVDEMIEELAWDVHHDGSVSDDGGYEAVTPQMTLRSWKEQHLPFIQNALVHNVEPTDTAGLHIHVGVNNISVPVRDRLAIAKKVTEFFAKHETEIVDKIAQRLYSRRQWCYKIGWENYTERMLRAFVGAQSLADVGYRADRRYHTLNLYALQKYGTIEFRLWNSTTDAKYIQSAVEFSVSVVAYAIAHHFYGSEFEADFLDFEQFKEFRWAMHELFMVSEAELQVASSMA